jgi:hypothetical protein
MAKTTASSRDSLPPRKRTSHNAKKGVQARIPEQENALAALAQDRARLAKAQTAAAATLGLVTHDLSTLSAREAQLRAELVGLKGGNGDSVMVLGDVSRNGQLEPASGAVRTKKNKRSLLDRIGIVNRPSDAQKEDRPRSVTVVPEQHSSTHGIPAAVLRARSTNTSVWAPDTTSSSDSPPSNPPDSRVRRDRPRVASAPVPARAHNPGVEFSIHGAASLLNSTASSFVPSPATSTSQPPPTRAPSPARCRWEAQQGFCTFGPFCRFTHLIQSSSVSPDVPIGSAPSTDAAQREARLRKFGGIEDLAPPGARPALIKRLTSCPLPARSSSSGSGPGSSAASKAKDAILGPRPTPPTPLWRRRVPGQPRGRYVPPHRRASGPVGVGMPARYGNLSWRSVSAPGPAGVHKTEANFPPTLGTTPTEEMKMSSPQPVLPVGEKGLESSIWAPKTEREATPELPTSEVKVSYILFAYILPCPHRRQPDRRREFSVKTPRWRWARAERTTTSHGWRRLALGSRLGQDPWLISRLHEPCPQTTSSGFSC